ncbi:hypothetical protein LOK49_LG07G00809 [Camellia lanceoleosa]|uniref:Uncharacterized protein n=1 Tax=Camellia lanceoleosa TaxID=1840588 RepID=A0ACC0H9R9_9ERIC|nr:hypothetical protein LOK49_LG07G00809 [Camellia lanceoleosa]
MAFKHVFLIIFAVIFPIVVSGKDFIVGDETGWTINFDYVAWAQGKDFRVGDKLVFQYPVGVHNVFKVNATGFMNCIVPPLSQALTSGNDTIVLATPGKKWYICGVGQHCALGGQKLVITVNSKSMALSVAPSPSQALPYTNSANGIVVNVFQSAMSVVMVAIMFILVA